MPNRARGPLLPWLALFTIWIVWGSTYLGMSAAVETMPPFLMTGARFFIAAPVLLALAAPAIRRGDVDLSPIALRSAAIIGLVLLIGGTALGALAQKWLDSSVAALLVSLNPIWMSLMAGFRLRTMPDKRMLGALLVGLVGITVMIGGPGGTEISMIGVGILAASSLFWCAGTVQSRFMRLPNHAFVSSGVQMLAGGFVLVILSFFLGEWNDFHLSEISQKSWMGFIWLVFMGSMLAYNAFSYANQKLPIEVVSTYAYVNPIIAVLLGATLDGDPIGPNVIIGGVIILSAVVFIVSGHRVPRGPVEETA